jgi:dTDP-4-dehydrorhamnose 3,5-epimerase
MKAEETNLKGCWIIEPNVFEDERGFFYEGFNKQRFKEVIGVDFYVKQLNQSRSSKGVLRGLHYQKSPKSQAKLITCTEGEVLDVAVDLRKDSKTFGQYAMVRLSAHNRKHLFIPKGMAHGFLVLSDQAKLMYQVDELYNRDLDSGIKFNDPDLSIAWSLPFEEMILSEKDQNLPSFREINFQ